MWLNNFGIVDVNACEFILLLLWLLDTQALNQADLCFGSDAAHARVTPSHHAPTFQLSPQCCC